MSAHPSSSQSSKSWWSRSKASKDAASIRSNQSSAGLPEMKPFPTIKHSKSKDSMTTSKLNSIVGNAFGKRSKKPTLTIQDPPPSVASGYSSRSTPGTAATSPVYSPEPFFSNRPPAKSVSSTVRSYEFDERSDPHTISEPRTPSDRPDRRSYQNSLFTLSDPDPFAAGSVIVPHFPQDPNRLSVYSDSSMLDPHGAKRFDAIQNNRISYGSSSSNSHSSPYDPYSPTSPSSPEMPRRPVEANQGEKRNRRETFILTDGPPGDPSGFDITQGLSERVQSGSVSSGSTVVPRQRFVSAATVFNAPEPLNREAVRPRGMTVAGEKARRPTINTAFSSPVVASAAPSRLRHQASQPFSQHSQSPSTTSTASPVVFSARSSVSAGSAAPQPPPGATRPLVLVRKASSSRVNLPPLTIQPPSHLPPPPLSPLALSDDVDSVESLVFPDPPSASSSYASLDEFPTAEEAHHFMTDEPTDPVLYGSPSPLQTFDLQSSADLYSDDRHNPSSSELSLTSPAEKRISGFSAQFIMERRGSEASVNSMRTSSFDDHASSSSALSRKSPKKQRSFPRLPLPGLRHNSAHSGPTSPETQQTPRSPSITGSPQPRRRLFSGSSLRRGSVSKGSSSPTPMTDDELRSINNFSLDDSPPRDTHVTQRDRHPPIMMSFTNMGNQLALVTENACIAPMWQEMLEAQNQPPHQAKRLSTADYVPQRIMSPTDMLKLEEQFAADQAKDREPERRQSKHDREPGDFGLSYVNPSHQQSPARSRTSSVLSSMSSRAHAFSDEDRDGDGTFGRLNPGRDNHVATSSRRPSTTEHTSPLRTGNPMLRGLTTSSTNGRPSTAQASFAPSPTTPIAQEQPPSPSHAATALPPPPRPRHSQGHVREDSELTRKANRVSVVPIQPLSPPPPRRKNSRAATIAEDEPEPPGPAPMPPPPPPPRPPSAFDSQKALHRRSVMRKPSFLEIDDDAEDDADLDFARGDAASAAGVRGALADIEERPALAEEPEDIEGSFLDLDRSSFDTVRSFDAESYRVPQPSYQNSFHAF